MESEPGVINPLDSIWTLLRMSPAFLLRDARHAMYDIFFCTSLPVCCLSLLRLKCQLLSGVPVYLVFPPAIYGYTHSIPGWTDLVHFLLPDICVPHAAVLLFQVPPAPGRYLRSPRGYVPQILR